jgi:hypothetical protein
MLAEKQPRDPVISTVLCDKNIEGINLNCNIIKMDEMNYESI